MAASPDIINFLNGVETVKAPGQSNVGYAWMMVSFPRFPSSPPSSQNSSLFPLQVNCLVSAGYVLAMRKRIKVTNFKDWDSMFYNNLLSIPVLVIFSLLVENWSYESLALNL